MRKKLPNFLIVGAAKSGTSSLHHYLNQHPDVFMSYIDKNGNNAKEPHFMVKEEVQNRLHFGVWNFKDYKDLFSRVNEEKAVGEASVFYLYYSELAITNIKKYLGSDTKIIIILRNPIDRAYSAYYHVSRSMKEYLNFEEALENEENRIKKDLNLTPMVMYRDMGLYYKMVKLYQENFKNVHILLHEDLKTHPKLELKKVFKFLEVNSNYNVDLSIKINVGGKKWRNKYFKVFLQKDSMIKRIVSFILSINLLKHHKKKLLSLFKRNINPMSRDTRLLLKDFFKEDISELSKIIDKDLDKWIK
tara:strand:+ start:40070 stop:40978 length:909 start_codon:yes stop_codon:yes gene_type:complete